MLRLVGRGILGFIGSSQDRGNESTMTSCSPCPHVLELASTFYFSLFLSFFSSPLDIVLPTIHPLAIESHSIIIPMSIPFKCLP